MKWLKFAREVFNVEKLIDVSSFALWQFEINIFFEPKALVDAVQGSRNRKALPIIQRMKGG